MLWIVTDDWMDKENKAKGISMERDCTSHGA